MVPNVAFPLFSGRVMLPVLICDNMSGGLLTRNAHLNSSIQRFYWGWLYRHDWLSYWFLRCWNLASRKTDTTWPTNPPLPNQTFSHYGMASVYPKTSEANLWPKQRHSYHEWLILPPRSQKQRSDSVWPKPNSLWHTPPKESILDWFQYMMHTLTPDTITKVSLSSGIEP